MGKKGILLQDKIGGWITVISIAVSILMHIPELISLFERHDIFPGIRLADVISEILVSFISLIMLFFVTGFFLGFHKHSNDIPWYKVLFSFLLCWALSSLFGHIFYNLHSIFDIPAVDATIHHYLHPVRDFIMAFIVSGSCYIISLIRSHRQHHTEIQQLRLENILNQYEALKNQLNPHMLFNSLNTLQTLIREEPVKAQEYTHELSNVLRYMLQGNESKVVTLADELEFVEAYIFLLKMRYEENIHFYIDARKELSDYLIPPMSLQVLVENAIKHNVISNRSPLHVSISSDNQGNIIVSNPIQHKLTSSAGTGIGLDNLAKRYFLLFKKEIEVSQADGKFCVTLPLIKPSAYEDNDNRG